MKKFILISAALLTLVSSAAASARTPKKNEARHHTVMSCNVRITGLEADEKDGRRWNDRKEVCVKVIRSRKPDIICFQEGIYESNAYLVKELKEYDSFGFEGPEMDPYEDGYHLIGKNMIFWNKKRYELIAEGCFWLSETPHIGGSISWDSSRARHCNWVRLRDRKSGEQFRVLDVHLDHITDAAKVKQTEVLIGETGQYAANFPQILCGDFNSGRKDPPYKMLTEAGWKDMYEEINGTEEVGATAHGWKEQKLNPEKKVGHRIDFIYARGGVKAVDAEIVRDRPDGILPSDHFFVCTTLEF